MSLSLFCLHSNRYSHFDLKPANILVNITDKDELIYYLADFGVTTFLEAKFGTYY